MQWQNIRHEGYLELSIKCLLYQSICRKSDYRNILPRSQGVEPRGLLSVGLYNVMSTFQHQHNV